MKDYNIFDRWVDSHDVSDHTHELIAAVTATHAGLQALLSAEPAQTALAAIRQMDADAWQSAYGETGRFAETEDREPADFLSESLERVDNLNFELGAFAHALYCYASGGMVEPAAGDTPIEVQRSWIRDWIDRGARIVTTTPEQLHPMPFFRLIVLGAQGRWEIDHDRPLTGDQVAALSALAKQPGFSSTVVYERVRKTVQNLIAEALGKDGFGTFKMTGDRLITPESALAWLRAQEPDYFPSTWHLPDPGTSSLEDECGSFVLVPVARAYLNVDAKPFTPDCRCEEGYEIGVQPEVFDDYWQALARLGEMIEPRFRHPGAHSMLGTLPCEERWLRLPRAQIEDQIRALADAEDASLEGPTATYVAQIDGDPRFRVHPKRHSRKLLRFESTRHGRALAVEKRKGAPVIYVARKDAESSPELMRLGRIVGSSPTGRNSNLNTIDSFKNEELLAIRPRDKADLNLVLDQLA